MNSARYVLFTFLSGDSFTLFKLLYRISQTSSKCGHSLNIVEMKKDGGGGGEWNKSHPPQWQIQGRGPEIGETSSTKFLRKLIIAKFSDFPDSFWCWHEDSIRNKNVQGWLPCMVLTQDFSHYQYFIDRCRFV